jgi:hypothetical protein
MVVKILKRKINNQLIFNIPNLESSLSALSEPSRAQSTVEQSISKRFSYPLKSNSFVIL